MTNKNKPDSLKKCGDCLHWMKKGDCPKEKGFQVGGPTAGTLACEKFQVKGVANCDLDKMRDELANQRRKIMTESGSPIHGVTAEQHVRIGWDKCRATMESQNAAKDKRIAELEAALRRIGRSLDEVRHRDKTPIEEICVDVARKALGGEK